MYASLISAGVSALTDLYNSATSKSTTSSFDAGAKSDASDTTGAVNSAGSSGGGLSDAVQKLLGDLQASTGSTTGSSTDATNTIAGDLKSVAKAGHGHGHGHHGGPPPSDDGSTTTATSGSATNPFKDLASSLLAYAKTQSLSATSSTSLTA